MPSRSPCGHLHRYALARTQFAHTLSHILSFSFFSDFPLPLLSLSFSKAATPLRDAVQLLTSNRLHRVYVYNGGNEGAVQHVSEYGVLTLTDVIDAVLLFTLVEVGKNRESEREGMGSREEALDKENG